MVRASGQLTLPLATSIFTGTFAGVLADPHGVAGWLTAFVAAGAGRVTAPGQQRGGRGQQHDAPGR